MGKESFPLKSALESDGDFFQCPPHPKRFAQQVTGPSREAESRELGSQY